MTLDKLPLGFLTFEMGMMTPIHGLGEYLDEMKCSISGSLSPVPPVSRHQYKFLHPPLLTYVLNLSPKGQG